jgi:hypothetical protein
MDNERSLTAVRLEELAVWAENEQREQRFDGSFQRDQNYADLARCARAWAKVERMLVDHPGSSITLVLGNKSMICLNVYDGTTGETAMECIEAVEAAEVKP